MSDPTLFGPQDPIVGTGKSEQEPVGTPRLATANRGQLAWGPIDLDARLPQKHVARVFWDMLDRLDLTPFYTWIKARGSCPGRPVTDPKILLALWLLATKEGITSAREIARLCTLHDAYRWICGGVFVSDHLLSEFRTENAAALDELFTQVLTVLLRQGVLSLERVAHDGMRVRASAGAASFRREASLEKSLREAQDYLEYVKREAAKPENQWSKRKAAGKERGARQRLKRVKAALREMPKVKEAKLKAARRQGPAAYKAALEAQAPDPPPPTPPAAEGDAATPQPASSVVEDDTAPPASDSGHSTKQVKKQSAPRVSTTDPDARVMKMPDGGFRPGFNFQFSTDAKTKVVVGVRVTNSGSDAGQVPEMLDEIEARTGRLPSAYLIDGGYVRLEDIELAERRGIAVYAPVPTPNSPKVDPYSPRKGDGPGVAAWRQRMASDEAKKIFKERAPTAEGVHADVRVHRGLDRMPVRGLTKVLSVGLLTALTLNLLRPVVVAALRSLV